MDQLEFLSFMDEFINGGGWYRRPSRYFKNAYFEFQSYSRWALEELRNYVAIHPEKRPIDSVVIFRSMMDEYACEAKSDKAKNIFSTAYDAVSDVLDHML